MQATELVTAEETQAALFDYEALESEPRERLRGQATLVRRLITETASSLIQIGLVLRETLPELGREQFERWCEAEFGFAPALAARYVQAAERFQGLNLLEHKVSAAALKELASAPEEAVKAVVGIAQKGGEVTREVARAAVRTVRQAQAEKQTELPEVAEPEDETAPEPVAGIPASSESEKTAIARTADQAALRKARITITVQFLPATETGERQALVSAQVADHAPKMKLVAEAHLPLCLAVAEGLLDEAEREFLVKQAAIRATQTSRKEAKEKPEKKASAKTPATKASAKAKPGKKTK